MTTRWLFGDQLGPHFVDDHPGPLVMVESKAVFRRRRFHRAKAHLVLSAMRHRAAELGDRVTYVQVETYAEVVREHGSGDGAVEVVHPTSYAALRLVERLGCTVLPPRGFATPREDFERWAEGRRGKRLVMEDFYRRARQAHTPTKPAPISSPGTMPARNNSPIETLLMTAYRIMGIEGGIRMSITALVALLAAHSPAG